MTLLQSELGTSPVCNVDPNVNDTTTNTTVNGTLHSQPVSLVKSSVPVIDAFSLRTLSVISLSLVC